MIENKKNEGCRRVSSILFGEEVMTVLRMGHTVLRDVSINSNTKLKIDELIRECWEVLKRKS